MYRTFTCRDLRHVLHFFTTATGNQIRFCWLLCVLALHITFYLVSGHCFFGDHGSPLFPFSLLSDNFHHFFKKRFESITTTCKVCIMNRHIPRLVSIDVLKALSFIETRPVVWDCNPFPMLFMPSWTKQTCNKPTCHADNRDATHKMDQFRFLFFII